MMTELAIRIYPALVWRALPDRDAIVANGNSLLDEGHVACANIISEVVSRFAWMAKRDKGMEAVALLITDSALKEDANSGLSALHPCGEPAIASMQGGFGQ